MVVCKAPISLDKLVRREVLSLAEWKNGLWRVRVKVTKSLGKGHLH